jgi:hypothetical protein
VALYGDVFAALNEHGIRYVVVGGVAVVLHGHARLTVDLDLVIDLATEPTANALELLAGLGFRPRLPVRAEDFADPAIRRDWVEQRHMQVFSLYDPADPLREIDIFATYPVPFEQLYAASALVPLGEVSVRVASVDHLVAMKEAAHRPQDLADIEALRRLGGGGTRDE